MRYSLMWPRYAKWWDRMKIDPSREIEFDRLAEKLFANRERYGAIEAKSGVPWPLIAVLHLRESSCDFGTYLGNGQSLKRKTTIVPRGRGPFTSFEEGALDALRIDGLSAVKDWRLEKMLFFAEAFNGGGYALRGLPSPYVWGGTNIQQPGKFVRDGKFNPRVMDTQPGCAPILATLFALMNRPDAEFLKRES